jgi:hypothetical protein
MSERDYNVDDMEYRHSLRQYAYLLNDELKGDDTKHIQIQTLDRTVNLDELELESMGMTHSDILDKWFEVNDSISEHISNDEYRLLVADKYRYTVNAKDLHSDLKFYRYSRDNDRTGNDINRYDKLINYLQLKMKAEQQKLLKTNYQIKKYEKKHTL